MSQNRRGSTTDTERGEASYNKFSDQNEEEIMSEISKIILTGQYDSTLLRCNQILEESPHLSEIWAYKGLIFNKQRLKIPASVCFEKVEDMSLKEEILLPEAGFAIDLLREPSSVFLLQQIPVSDPELASFFDLMFTINSLYFNKNRIKFSNYLKSLLKQYPHDPALISTLAYAETKMDHSDRAMELLSCAVSYASLPMQHRILGVLFDLMDKEETAIYHYLMAAEDLIYRENLVTAERRKILIKRYPSSLLSLIEGKRIGELSKSDANLFLLSSLIIPNSKTDDIQSALKKISNDTYENIFSTIAAYSLDEWTSIPRLTSYEGPHKRIHSVATELQSKYEGDFRKLCQGVSKGEIASKLGVMGAAENSINVILTGLYIAKDSSDTIDTWDPGRKISRIAARIILGKNELPNRDNCIFSRIQRLSADVDGNFYSMAQYCLEKNPDCYVCKAKVYCIYRVKKRISTDYS